MCVRKLMTTGLSYVYHTLWIHWVERKLVAKGNIGKAYIKISLA